MPSIHSLCKKWNFLFPPIFAISLLLHRGLLLHSRVNARLDHVFITRAFFYPKSTFLDGVSPLHNVVVVLANAEGRLEPELLDPVCSLPDPDSAAFPAQLARAESLHSAYWHAPCRLGIVRLICHSLPAQPTHIGVQFRGSTPIRVKITPAETVPRQLVICPGRMFLFDQWHLLITALELHRAQGVDLVVVHIQSVLASLYPILRAYQLDGLVRLRPSLRMPSSALGTLTFDPNEETLWNNQLVNFQDCLYEFKESAAFIAFPDWDDLLLTPGGGSPLPSALLRFTDRHPNVGTILPQRFPGHIPRLAEMRAKGIDLAAIFGGALRFSTWPSHAQFISKAVVRPRFVGGVELHWAGRMAEGFEQAQLPPQHAFFVHARDYEVSPLSRGLPASLAERLSVSQAKFLSKHNISLDVLPRSEQFLPVLNRCLAHIEARVRSARASKCFNYAHCGREIGEQKNQWTEEQCVGADTQWGAHMLRAQSMHVFVLRSERIGYQWECVV